MLLREIAIAVNWSNPLAFKMMATLKLENLPDELYQSLHQLAAQQQRSPSEAAIALLTFAIQHHDRNSPTIAQLLSDIRRDRDALVSNQWLDSTTLIREDRDR
jgi:plasmid stability protein